MVLGVFEAQSLTPAYLVTVERADCNKFGT